MGGLSALSRPSRTFEDWDQSRTVDYDPMNDHGRAYAMAAYAAGVRSLGARYEAVVGIARELQEASIEDHEWGDLWAKLDAALAALDHVVTEDTVTGLELNELQEMNDLGITP